MTIRVKEILDLMLMAIVLCIGLMTGVWTTLTESQELRKYASSYTEKNATQKYTPSIKVYGSYNGTLSKEDILLVSQIQDYEMYGPHTLAYEGEAESGSVDLHPGYEMFEEIVRGETWSMLAQDEAQTSYFIEYDYGTDAYQVRRYYGICPGCGSVLYADNIHARRCFTFDCGHLLRCGRAGCEVIPSRENVTIGTYDRCSCGGYITCPDCGGYAGNGYCRSCRMMLY